MRWIAASTLVLAACASPTVPSPADNATAGADTALVPLTEMGARTYLGFQGGLYSGGANVPPADHARRAADAARRIQPLDANGQPSANGKYVLLSIGMSNTTQEFCGGAPTSCSAVSFVGQALANPAVDRTHLAIVDGAQGGQPIEAWDDPAGPTYDRVRSERLGRLGLTEAQVQVVWIKQANPRPTVALPAADADAYAIAHGLADIIRAVRVRYPNVRMVFLSSRIYGGFARPGTLNPEPFAYESGFGVKWVVEEPIRQAGGAAARAGFGDLRPATTPWIGWGPYLWANGTTPRADGLTWTRGDFQNDATHPADGARRKVGRLLLDFLTTSPYSACWFLAGETC